MMISNELANKLSDTTAFLILLAALISALITFAKHRRPREIKWDALSTGITIFAALASTFLFWVTNIKEEYAEKRLAEYNQKTEKATLAARDAERLTAQIQKDNTDLQLRLEKERIARLELERKIAPRRLTSDQKTELIEILKRYTGQKIRVVAHDTTESIDYAIDFAEVFKKAGWQVLNPGTSIDVWIVKYDNPPPGIQIGVYRAVPENSKIRQVAQALVETLFNTGLVSSKVLVAPIHDSLPDAFEISIARKPE